MNDGLGKRAHAIAAGGDSWWIAGEAQRRIAAGDDIIALTIGDPDGPPPPAVTAAAVAALHAGRTHYSFLDGEPALRSAAAAWHSRTQARPVHAENVFITPGAQHALLAVMQMLVDAGDEVIVPGPHYATYPSVVISAGATIVDVPCTADLAFDIAGIIAAITPRTRAILLNSPANPSGKAIDAAGYAALCAAAKAQQIWLIADEVYARFRFSGSHVGLWDHGPPDRSVVLASLSKSHRMTGFRLGWAIAPPALARALGDWSAASLFGVSTFVQDAGIAALAVPDTELAPYWDGFAARAALVVARANAMPGLHATLPDGGMFVLVNVRGIDADDNRFARALLRDTGVAVMPGSGFGSAAAGHVRIGLCADAATLNRAFDRIGEFVAARWPASAPGDTLP
jgi:arginine:pyruvate transaminase